MPRDITTGEIHTAVGMGKRIAVEDRHDMGDTVSGVEHTAGGFTRGEKG